MTDAAPRDDWQTEAACIGMPPEWWFPLIGEGRKAAKAKKVCQGCPVRGECLAFAQSTGVVDGIWAGVNFSGGFAKKGRGVARGLCRHCTKPLVPRRQVCDDCLSRRQRVRLNGHRLTAIDGEP